MAAAAAGAVTVGLLSLAAPAGATPGCAAPPDFEHSVPGPAGGPAAAATLGSSVYFATIGGDRKVYFVETNIDEPDLDVGHLECKGGGAVDTPAVTDYDDGKALFVLGPNGRIYQNYTLRGSSPATPWTMVPGAPAGGGAPAVTRLGLSGPLELFVRGSNGQLYHATRGAAASGTWSAWESLGGGMTGVAAVGSAPGDGQLVAVVRAPNGTLYQRVGRTGAWSPWQKLPGTTSASPTLAQGFSRGRLDLFVTGTTGGLYQSTWLTGKAWTAFRKVDPELPPATKLAATGKAGRMIVYATVRVDGETAVGYDQYIPKLGWSGFDDAPYTCDDCLPDESPALSGGMRRAPDHPMR